jgi:hypothetical protein
MEVYQNNPKDFLKLFPKEVLGSITKEGGYTSSKSFYALQRYNFIQYNSQDRINIICVDIDEHQDGSVWLDHDLPQPTWTVWTNRGVQFMWVLDNPIFTCNENKYRNKHLAYAKDVLNKIVYALDAATNAIGFNRVFRNPLTHDSRYSNSRVNLKDFNHLESPSSEWLDKVYPKREKHKTLFGSTRDREIDFASMEEGDGRNSALFDRLRYWAYDEAKAGTYTEFDLAHRGYVLNQAFKKGLEGKEVDRIITSIDKFIENTYMRSNYMAKTTPEERSKIASKNGSKGGAIRKAEAYGRIVATITQMQSFDIKITVSEVARRAKADRGTVRNYLTEKGWNEASRKEGWKQ